jgi:hypothetical protein
MIHELCVMIKIYSIWFGPLKGTVHVVTSNDKLEHKLPVIMLLIGLTL